jgi:hypothetical protein
VNIISVVFSLFLIVLNRVVFFTDVKLLFFQLASDSTPEWDSVSDLTSSFAKVSYFAHPGFENIHSGSVVPFMIANYL